ncbi:MAG: hypothetical protein ACR2OG_08470 [Gemmatimonadaceae bacterium]
MCDHPKRNEIDRRLVDRSQPFRYVSLSHRLSLSAVYRHFAEHLPAALVKASGAKEIARGDALLQKVQTLLEAAEEILVATKKTEDYKTALGAIRESRETMALLARLLGELAPDVSVSVAVGAEWLALRAVLLAALDPYPVARLAVVEALGSAERVHAHRN